MVDKSERLMCTYSFTLNDKLLDAVRPSFQSEESMKAWMQEQLTVLLQTYSSNIAVVNDRSTHKHDALMGVLAGASEFDCKREHLKEKYGV